VCWTEVPERMRTLVVQRSRWHRGLLQTLWLYRDMFLRKRYGSVGLIGMPWYLMFELLAPIIELLGYILIPAAWAFGILNTHALVGYLLLSMVLGTLLSIGSILMEELAFRRYARWQELLRLMAYGILENFGYRQFLTLVKVKALSDALWRRRAWGEMQRQGLGAARPTKEGP